jgi:hypothetical protein
MKNALIAPNESPVQYISGWTTDTPPEPIYTSIENSWRVAQVETQTFEVSAPLFWTLCDNDVMANQFYYCPSDKEFYLVPESPPYPESQIHNP